MDEYSSLLDENPFLYSSQFTKKHKTMTVNNMLPRLATELDLKLIAISRLVCEFSVSHSLEDADTSWEEEDDP